MRVQEWTLFKYRELNDARTVLSHSTYPVTQSSLTLGFEIRLLYCGFRSTQSKVPFILESSFDL